MSSLVEVVKAAAPYGGGIAVVLAIVAAASAAAQKAIEVRRAAVERANPADVPKLIGDEIDKLQIRADGMTRDQKFQAVMLTLGQRENRNKRLFVLALVVAILVAIVAVVGLLLDPVRPNRDQMQPNVPQGGRSASAEPPTTVDRPIPCVGAQTGDINAGDAARVNVGTPCPKAGDITAIGSARVDIGSESK